MFDLDTVVLDYLQACLPGHACRLHVHDTQLHPYHGRTSEALVEFNRLFDDGRNILGPPEYVYNFNLALEIFGKIEQRSVAPFA
jgi:hypothetical protein